MTELAFWAWIILLIILFVGPWIFLFIGLGVVIYLFVRWRNPDLLKKL